MCGKWGDKQYKKGKERDNYPRQRITARFAGNAWDSSNGEIEFNSKYQNQRPGLLWTNDRILNDVQRFQGLQSAAGTADGADKLLSYANQIAAEQTLQLMQMRALCNQMLEEAAAREAALANRQALMDAATQQALSDSNSDNGGHKLPQW
jgi:P-type conjugative transfer protein TrbJ